MIFNKNVKYKCKNARVVKCVSNEMVCHVVEIKVDNIWMPYKVTGDLSHAIDIDTTIYSGVSSLESEKIKFEKRVDTYFKKYGTSKLNTWTYWKDE